eukprot:COSAG02_NODE_19643_length_871_cov_4.281088_1_plen_64_part_10
MIVSCVAPEAFLLLLLPLLVTKQDEQGLRGTDEWISMADGGTMKGDGVARMAEMECRRRPTIMR